LTTAKTVAKVSVVSDTAGEKKSLAADPQVLTIPRSASTANTLAAGTATVRVALTFSWSTVGWLVMAKSFFVGWSSFGSTGPPH
jgi:hypothetical protein